MARTGSNTRMDITALDIGSDPKDLPCRFCQRRFRKREHVQRHERIHTKEKPFRCRCGQTFARRDLLARHDKLIHLNNPTKPSSNSTTPLDSITRALPTESEVSSSDPLHSTAQMDMLAPGANLLAKAQDSASHANGLVSTLNNGQFQPPIEPLLVPRQSIEQIQAVNGSTLASNGHLGSTTPGEVLPGDGALADTNFFDKDIMGDYNLFLDDFGLGQCIFADFGADFPVSAWSRPLLDHTGLANEDYTLPQSHHTRQNDNNPFSRFGSRLPSLQLEAAEPSSTIRSQLVKDFTRSGPRWKITAQDHRDIQRELEEFSNVLPANFALPSRYTLSRYLDGYINGFHEHLPFLHIPTVTISKCALELLLALAAVGALYRFEERGGNDLWYFAKSIALEQIRRRNIQRGDAPSPGSLHRHSSFGPAVNSILNEAYGQRSDARSAIGRETQAGRFYDYTNTPQARLETIQALMVLMAVGTWGPGSLLREALTLRSLVALLVKDEGLSNREVPSGEEQTWADWVAAESQTRTKFVAYCFFNLQCIAYDLPPLILSSEVYLSLPQPADQWKAKTAELWFEIRHRQPPMQISFHEALGKLFVGAGPGQNLPPISSLGNYILMTALIQQIFFVRQTSSLRMWNATHHSLDVRDIDQLSQGLQAWQASWEASLESSLDPSNPSGPVAFNSTALLRLGYIRLHSNLGPCRKLDSHDPVGITRALMDSPALNRTPQLTRAVLQSAHALSIPVKLGIAYVARTQTLSWSIQHSLCNLECAFLLSKWLQTIAISNLDLSEGESTLLNMVRSMLDETDFAVPFEIDNNGAQINDRAHIRKLSANVVRLWAETFKGIHIFEIANVIAATLDHYAHSLEQVNSEME